MTSHSVHHHDHYEHTADKVVFGFWIYVMTDAIMFATLFATYAVLHNNTYGGPGIMQVASLHHMLVQTLIMIVGAFTYGLGFVAFHRGRQKQLAWWLVITFLLGVSFLVIQVGDAANVLHQGYSWQTSAFLSCYFSLLGIFGLHVLVALLWMFCLFIQLQKQKLSVTMRTRFTCFGLFWNFLNLMWLVMFTIVFLMGAI